MTLPLTEVDKIDNSIVDGAVLEIAGGNIDLLVRLGTRVLVAATKSGPVL